MRSRRASTWIPSDQLDARLDALIAEAWAAPVRSFDDAVLLAEIIQHQQSDWPTCGEASEDLLHPPNVHNDEAVGRLVRAVLALAEKPFTAALD